MEAMGADCRPRRLAGKMLECDGRVDQAAIEEDPSWMRGRCLDIGQ